jgi:hypothetical protein
MERCGYELNIGGNGGRGHSALSRRESSGASPAYTAKIAMLNCVCFYIQVASNKLASHSRFDDPEFLSSNDALRKMSDGTKIFREGKKNELNSFIEHQRCLAESIYLEPFEGAYNIDGGMTNAELDVLTELLIAIRTIPNNLTTAVMSEGILANRIELSNIEMEIENELKNAIKLEHPSGKFWLHSPFL